ncbi:uncharacterized protein EI90DRAFT_3293871 [Cantharellus anzutake]|uniref:uncharacterized protein n=1 Tax=Cantharellus anzutake TaxID=1750568 RepID=UPI00190836E3|nr:uncharacterized protein EI90DRAFT_3293871 [Cantharellus anzutake]KAF8315746.1 hypothetical protein EI90DRAFT_3293871 [Cantharellus anzutake]
MPIQVFAAAFLGRFFRTISSGSGPLIPYPLLKDASVKMHGQGPGRLHDCGAFNGREQKVACSKKKIVDEGGSLVMVVWLSGWCRVLFNPVSGWVLKTFKMKNFNSKG